MKTKGNHVLCIIEKPSL